MRLNAWQICVMSDEEIDRETDVKNIVKWKKPHKRLYLTYEHFAALFTPKRLELLEAIRNHPDENVTQLAKRLGRLQEAISRDLKFLESMDLINRDDKTTPISTKTAKTCRSKEPLLRFSLNA